jgi:hypothetical protein
MMATATTMTTMTPQPSRTTATTANTATTVSKPPAIGGKAGEDAVALWVGRYRVGRIPVRSSTLRRGRYL